MFAHLIHAIAPDQRLQNIFFLPLQVCYHQNPRLTKDSVKNSLTVFLLWMWCHLTEILGVTVNQRFFIAIVILLVASQPSCTIRADEFVFPRSFDKLFTASIGHWTGYPPPPIWTAGLSMEFKRVQWGKRKLIWPPIRLKNSQKRPNSLLEEFSSKHEAVLYIQ